MLSPKPLMISKYAPIPSQIQAFFKDRFTCLWADLSSSGVRLDLCANELSFTRKTRHVEHLNITNLRASGQTLDKRASADRALAKIFAFALLLDAIYQIISAPVLRRRGPDNRNPGRLSALYTFCAAR
jgi:hypothetical protein